MSLIEEPAVEAIIGLLFSMILSSKGQSVNEQLATFIISKSWDSISLTDSSSNGVDIVRVHDVEEIVRVAKVSDRIIRGL